jgi:starch phosphorylase
MKDFDAYIAAQKTANDLYKDTDKWSRMSAMNIAHSGIFASDETIKRYAAEIWNL